MKAKKKRGAGLGAKRIGGLLESQARLRSAAPMLLGALCLVEWWQAGWPLRGGGGADGGVVECPFCYARGTRPRHRRSCRTDLALRAAGLTSQRSREDAAHFHLTGERLPR